MTTRVIDDDVMSLEAAADLNTCIFIAYNKSLHQVRILVKLRHHHCWVNLGRPRIDCESTRHDTIKQALAHILAAKYVVIVCSNRAEVCKELGRLTGW